MHQGDKNPTRCFLEESYLKISINTRAIWQAC